MHPHEYNLNKAAYSVEETLDILPLGRTSIYAAIKQGKLRATKFGTKTIFLAADLAAFLAALPVMQNTSAPDA